MEIEIRHFSAENILYRSEMINETWALICEISFWGWGGSVIGLILNSFPARNKIKVKSVFVWGISFLVFYAFWIVGMLNT
jgi:hypothetical protein